MHRRLIIALVSIVISMPGNLLAAEKSSGAKEPVSQQRFQFTDAANYSSLDETDVPREYIKRNPLEALKFTRDTLELVEKSAKRPELRKRLDQIEKETLALIKSSSTAIPGKPCSGFVDNTYVSARIHSNRNILEDFPDNIKPFPRIGE